MIIATQIKVLIFSYTSYQDDNRNMNHDNVTQIKVLIVINSNYMHTYLKVKYQKLLNKSNKTFLQSDFHSTLYKNHLIYHMSSMKS